MDLVAVLTTGEKIAFWGVIVAAAVGVLPIILYLLKRKNSDAHKKVDVKRIDGDGTVIGDKATVTIDKRREVDGEIILSKVIEEATAKGRAEEQIAQLKDELAKAVERIKKLESEGNRPDAEKALEEFRKSRDMTQLQKLLIKDRDEHRDSLIQRNREIAAVAYLRGDIDVSEEAVDEILKIVPDDLFALNERAHIHRLRGELNEAENDLKRVLDLSVQVKDNQAQAAALGNLGVIYHKRGQLDKAEEMHNKSLEIEKRLGRPEGMAGEYGNLGLIYQTQGQLDKAERMFKKSLEISEAKRMLELTANSYGNLGNVYQERGELNRAEQMYHKVLEIEEKLGRPDSIANAYSNLGLVYKKRGDVEKAREYWEKARDLYEKIGMKPDVEEVQGWLDEPGKGSE